LQRIAMTAPEPDERPVTLASMPMAGWLELFYDLIFVAAILVFSSAVSHVHDVVKISWVAGVAIALWWIWLSTTMYINRFRADDFFERVLVLAQMFLVVLLAVEALEGVRRDSVLLSLTFAALIGTVGIMYLRSARSGSPLAAFARSRATFAFASTAVFLVAAPLDDPVQGVLWGLGLAITIIPAVGQSKRLGPTAAIDERHGTERLGAFTIIVLGEAFVKVAVAISTTDVVRLDLAALAFQFVLTFSIWSSYFEDIPNAGIGRRRFEAWTALHLLMQLGISATAIAVAQLVAVGPLDEVPDDVILEITVSLMVIYAALALLGTCTRRRPIRPLLTLRLATVAAFGFVGGLAWAISSVDVLVGLGALSVVAIGHAFIASRLCRETEVIAA
jgi:low temperature requirement protein LtrA